MPPQGEGLVRIAELLARGREVWEHEEDAWEFLHSPHPLLDGERPIDRARSEQGARQVAELLWKLDLGLPV
jgi:putative toxin-antitoxin system antitoxin component (TIGR02293 family)